MHSNLDRRERTCVWAQLVRAGGACVQFYPLVMPRSFITAYARAAGPACVHPHTRCMGRAATYGFNPWSGDVVPRWDDLREQIAPA